VVVSEREREREERREKRERGVVWFRLIGLIVEKKKKRRRREEKKRRVGCERESISIKIP